MKIKKISIIVLCILILTGCKIYHRNEEQIKNVVISKDTKIKDVINDATFDGYGNLLFPTSLNIKQEDTLNDLDTIMTNNTNVNVNTTMEVLNYMKNRLNEGNKVFYNIYTPEEITNDYTLKDVGLFFFKGNDNERFNINVPGSNYEYSSAIQDGFPISLELAKNGYNSFTLIYRQNKENAVEDLTRAIKYIIENKDTFKINTEAYSLWGSDVGGEIVNKYTVNNKDGENTVPTVLVLQYSKLSEISGKEVPTYSCVGKADPIHKTVEQRNTALKNIGIKAEVKSYEGLEHGFGLGKNTAAEGWINDAIRFWKDYIKK